MHHAARRADARGCANGRQDALAWKAHRRYGATQFGRAHGELGADGHSSTRPPWERIGWLWPLLWPTPAQQPAATGPPPGKKILVDDDILDDAAAHARTLETSLTAHQAEVQRLKKILKEQQREIPDAYLCPITMDPMEDPCIAADGHSYERRAITDWFARGNNTSPKTGAQLDDTRLFPNHALKSAIQDFLEEVRRFDAATAGARD